MCPFESLFLCSGSSVGEDFNNGPNTEGMVFGGYMQFGQS